MNIQIFGTKKYKNNINEGDKVCYDKNDPDFVISQIEAKNSGCSVFRMN